MPATALSETIAYQAAPGGPATALRGLGLVVATLIGVKQALLPFTPLYAGPASALMAMILATYVLRRKGASWRDLGFNRPKSWLKTIGLTALTMGFVILCTQAMGLFADRFFEGTSYGARFDHVEGNLAAYLMIMLVVWTHGSFFEELLFRAFVMTHTSALIGRPLRGDAVALLVSSVFFGYRHAYYQGIHGALLTGASGFAFGLFYLWFGRRNILPLIFAHGVINTLGQTFRYLGIEA